MSQTKQAVRKQSKKKKPDPIVSKLESEIDSLKSRLSNLAHEIRAPLAALEFVHHELNSIPESHPSRLGNDQMKLLTLAIQKLQRLVLECKQSKI